MTANSKLIVSALLSAIVGHGMAQNVPSAQNVTDVEPKPYGSYAGTKIDTVDLATGNLYLNIPLISYPQVGRLPPLSFSVGLNNSPYDIEGGCTSSTSCSYSPRRYDPSPPGNISQSGLNVAALANAKLGAFLQSSFDGGLVIGSLTTGNGSYSSLSYTLIDESGQSHQLASDSSNPPTSWNTFRSLDGTGYTFTTSVQAGSFLQGDNSYDSSLQSNIGLGGALPGAHNNTNSWYYWLGSQYSSSAVHLGTITSPTGIQFTNTFVSEPASALPAQFQGSPTRLIATVESDGSNQVTRSPWYWSNAILNAAITSGTINSFYNSSGNAPTYVDSVNRRIPDIISLSETVPALAESGSVSANCPTIPNQPSAKASMPWTVPGPGGNSLQYLFCYVPINIDYDWADYGTAQYTESRNPIWETGYAIQSILLPDNRSYWGFIYDQNTLGSNCSTPAVAQCGSGDLLKVMLPTGGTIAYTYENVGSSPSNPNQAQRRCASAPAPFQGGGECHAIMTRTVSDGINAPSTTTYSYAATYTNCNVTPDPCEPPFSPTIYKTTETTPSGDDVVHTFQALNSSPLVTNQETEIETDYYQGPSTNAGCTKSAHCLKAVYMTYNGGNLPSWNIVPTSNGGAVGYPYNFVNPMLTSSVSLDTGSGQTTTINNSFSPLFTAVGIACNTGGGAHQCAPLDEEVGTTVYPAYSVGVNFLSATKVDTYGANQWLQTSKQAYQFLTSPNSSTPALPVSMSNTDLSGNTIFAEMSYGYDGNGNETSTRKMLNSAQAAVASTVYNGQNVPYLTQDPNGNQTYVSSFQCAGLFPRSITKAYQSTSAVPETLGYSYDCNTGQMTGATDASGGQTEYIYSFDSLGRLSWVLHGTGTSTYSVGNSLQDYPTTTLSATGASYSGLTTASVFQDQGRLYDELIRSATIYDGLGRPVQTINAAGYTVTTSYNLNGQVAAVTNPEGATASSTDGTTSYYYDPFGRVVEVVAPGATSWKCYDGIADLVHPQPNCSTPHNTNAGTASWVDGTDESGNHTQQVSNSLGQLIAVIEPSPQTGALALETDYSYDHNGNLSSVVQLGASGETPRSRSFMYDAASRLLWSQNPESGVVCYGHGDGTTAGCQADGYDLNGNLLYKTDARGVTASYRYDGLSRLLWKMFSANEPNGVPSSCYQYDSSGTAFGMGRLTREWTQKGVCSSSPPANPPTMKSIQAYDYMGRVATQQQCVFGNCSINSGQSSYTYDLAGDLTAFGDGRGVISFAKQYDTAARVQAVTASPGGFTLFSGPVYGASGGLTSAMYGMGTQNSSPLTQSRTYDNRLRVTSETDGVTQ